MERLKALRNDEVTGKTKELFTGIEGKLGMVPNMMRTMANSSVVLEAYLNLSGTLSNGKLGTKTSELIALAVAESNSCDYCISAHTYIGTKLAHIDSETLENARAGKADDAKTTAVLSFAKTLVSKKGLVNNEDVEAIKSAGFSDGEIGEIVAHVALNIFTNYFNNTAKPNNDFIL